MIALDLLLSATEGRLVRRGAAAFPSVCIDGRSAGAGALWFAIRGERFDGHDFAAQAIAAGARGLVVERGRGEAMPRHPGVAIVEVDDTIRALGRLGRAHRESLPALRVVGVTGSNGKTTTKELLAAIFAAHAGDAAVHKTTGNLNNHLGVPLTLLGLTAAHRFAVVEMGMSALGEIAYLAELARPEVGVIVNAGPVHLETLGTVENVARAKGELHQALPARGAAIYPDGDPRLAAQADSSPALRKIRFGTRRGVEVRVAAARVLPDGTEVALRLPDGQGLTARLAAVGAHHGLNAAAAAAAAYALAVPAPAIAAGLAAARPEKHRSQVVDIAGRRVIDDCYNASPLSTGAALDTLAQLKGEARAVALLGDMLELGADETMLHRSMGERAARLGVDALITVGARMAHAAEAARAAGMAPERVIQAASPDEAAARAAELARPGDWILVKASRGMKLEQAIDALRVRFAATQHNAGTGAA